jgi:hypothetical protein
MQHNIIKSARFLLFILAIGFFSNSIRAQQVATEILDDVVIKQSDYNAVIKILFKRPVAYLSHNPANSGSTINVSVNLLGSLSRNDTIDTESIRVISDTGLTEVVFEKLSGSSASILLYFSKNVSYEVIQSSDQRGLSIVIYGLD